MSWIKNIVNKFFNPETEPSKPDVIGLGNQLSSADLDYKFAQLFTHAGGVFNYCENEAEALQVLASIIKVEDLKSIFCWDEDLKNFLNVIKTPYTEDLELFNDAAFITCEYLIAYDGKVMLSHQNIKHYSSAKLPNKIIIMATVSQIVTNLAEAMMKIKRKKAALKNLTSISGSGADLDGLAKGNTKLFLLLLEDQEPS
ncbi:LUD domain-containing protein [Riemerella columbina]|uniref:LUD domain-containing protein n=1 Tax=Riemerella columbina TaxID=103810 RepID=UPI00266F1BCF|nr:LUD domain-containing protein [Riemerella columbina]WKS95464.1 lactate utilization protein [Riemerella columbina]